MVVDDHPAFRIGLISLIEKQPGMTVVAEAGDGRQVLDLFRRNRPDVVLMDLRLPGYSGVEATIALRKEFPDCRIIVITTYDCDEDIYRACQSGAQSYLLKDTSAAEIVRTIRAVCAGEQRFPALVADRLAKRLEREEISQRELEVLQLIVKGRSNKEIAATLSVSEDTIKFHLRRIFAKLDVQDRTEAAICAIRHGIVHIE
jgi:two-component system NarL family response regulator